MLSKKSAIVDWQNRFLDLQTQAQDPRLRAYYSDELPDSITPVSDIPMVAMDFETTGLDPHSCDIVSIGLLPFSMHRIYASESKHWLLSPKQPLSEDSIIFHGITHSDIDAAPNFAEVFDDLLEALTGKVVVVHCREIEQQFLSRRCQELTGEPLYFPTVDTMELEARALEGRRGALDKFLRRPLGSLNLADARLRYSLPTYQAHHALTDAQATAELLQAQIAYHYRPDTPIRELWQ